MTYLLEHDETARLHFRNVSVSDFDQWLKFFTDPSSFEHWAGAYESPRSNVKNGLPVRLNVMKKRRVE